MPPHLLATFTNSLLIVKILAGCSVTPPIKLNSEDIAFIGATEEINKAIKATAHTITKTKLSDKVCTENVLQKANLRCLNLSVASIMALRVWKAKKTMILLGKRLFQERTKMRSTRFESSDQIYPPVPRFPSMALSLMARVWNNIPDLQSALTLSSARKISETWARSIPR